MRLRVGILQLALLCAVSYAPGQTGVRPNILWITSEDNGPHLGAYGDTYARTPNLDQLAARGMVYLNAWSCGPVCAPARTALVSGLYPPATGSEHMRSMTRLPDHMKMYPQFLREIGYYCTNNSKEDYNLEKPGQVWDESSSRAHWKNRRPGQPFFAVFNHTISHESQIRRRPHTLVHDPAQVRLPAYHPDTPEVRQDWAQYYDNLTEMDARAGQNLRELEQAGLAENTIVFYYSDHGSGMPRSKRWPYNSGLQVPLIVYIPEKFRHLAPPDYVPAGKSERLVSFVDFAPTLLSLAGIKPPEYFQGHAFMGPYASPPQPYIYGFRGRMDERYDLVRSVRDRRYVYIRNFMPHKIYGQYLAYMFQTPTTQVWKRLFDTGQLRPPQTYFWEPKPSQELYDLETDPDEVHDLVHSPAHRSILGRMRKAQRELALEIRDVGFLPEGEIHTRSQGSTPYEMGHDDEQYPLARILKVAELASSLEEGALPQLKEALEDPDTAARYWGALGILMRGQTAVQSCLLDLRRALEDPSPYVRMVAAQAVAQHGTSGDAERGLSVLLELAPLDQSGIYVSMMALNAIDELDGKAAPYLERIKALPTSHPSVIQRMSSYIPRLIEKILGDLGVPPPRSEQLQ